MDSEKGKDKDKNLDKIFKFRSDSDSSIILPSTLCKGKQRILLPNGK
jgi:hypothetical protein